MIGDRSAFSPIPRRELVHEAVQAALRAYIVEHRLRPGDHLPPEGDLARELQVSRSSVREAVKALQSLGIIEARKGSGLYVRGFTLETVLDHMAFGMLFDVESLANILDVRLIIESGMVDRVVQHVRPEQLEELGRILDDWRGVTERGEYPAVLDRAFHATLYAHGVNPLVGQILDAFWRVFYQARAHALVPEPAEPMETFVLHVGIYEALRSGDVVAMRDATNKHHEGIRRRVDVAAAKIAMGDEASIEAKTTSTGRTAVGSE